MDKLVIRHILWLIFIINDLAEIRNQLFLDHVGLLTRLKSAVCKHARCQVETKLLSNLNHSWDIQFAFLLEAQLNELVVVVQCQIYAVGLVLRLVIRRQDLYLSRRVPLHVAISLEYEGCHCILSNRSWLLEVLPRLVTFLRETS